MKQTNVFTFQQLFLIDGSGAALSAVMLVVLSFFETTFGMPGQVLFRLLPVVLLFSGYSFACYYLSPANGALYLTIIAIANLFYCSLTLYLIFLYFEKLTILGILYFLAEKIIIIALAIVELKAAKAIVAQKSNRR